ncbi:HipA N-terminal domain-containing protein [Aureibaculum algae]|uniref:HipA N-terminal domain-containing protein n=1 Tax=Aureibaculum algae TaxID=2584122 RepID=UPI003742E784
MTFTMPVREKPYKEKRLFPFFEGLIPEGWLLDIASKNWKINKNDRMGLLLTCCQNCIGAVSVEPITEEENGA